MSPRTDDRAGALGVACGCALLLSMLIRVAFAALNLPPEDASVAQPPATVPLSPPAPAVEAVRSQRVEARS